MSAPENKHPLVKISKNASAQSAKTEAEWNALKSHSEGALSPSMNGAAVVESFAKGPFGEVDLVAAISTLNEQIEEIQRGDMSGPEAMLYAQATALQAIFVNYARRATCQEYQRNLEAFMSLALKAQAQCRATLEALNEMKFPKSATFVKQANIASQQQVNNGALAHAEKITDLTNEQLKEGNHATVDLGGTAESGAANPALETLGQFDGTKNRRRKEAQRSKCC
jgi:hypothetical protein